MQLFNAVREQQKDMKSQLRQAGGSFRKQEKVFMFMFLSFSMSFGLTNHFSQQFSE